MASSFLFNEALWEELGVRVPSAKLVRAAVAYLGTGASGLLPLRKGDRLVVDMSLRAVRAGTTDPREVEKFLRKGVEVFSRGSLHTKFFILDKTTIAGSSNLSNHAKNSLDEAAVLTDDPATTRRASAIFDQLCTEPVRKDYLQKCIEAYRPPKFTGGPPQGAKGKRLSQGKVWIIGGLVYRELPEDEENASERALKKVGKKLKDFERSAVEFSHYAKSLGFFGRIREGDWLIVCIGDGKGFDVYPPARFLGVEHYARGKGKRRFLLLREVPSGAKSVRWTAFQRAVPQSIKTVRSAKPRTAPITDEADADALLRLWNARGQFRRKGTS